MVSCHDVALQRTGNLFKVSPCLFPSIDGIGYCWPMTLNWGISGLRCRHYGYRFAKSKLLKWCGHVMRLRLVQDVPCLCSITTGIGFRWPLWPRAWEKMGKENGWMAITKKTKKHLSRCAESDEPFSTFRGLKADFWKMLLRFVRLPSKTLVVCATVAERCQCCC